MTDLFQKFIAETQGAALMDFCKMEKIEPSALLRTGQAKNTLKLRLKTAAYHLLQRIDRKLDVMISRMTVEMEHSGMVQGRLS